MFFLDDEAQPTDTYNHDQESESGYLYNQRLFTSDQLPQREHTLLVSVGPPTGNAGSYISFDYAVYTYDRIFGQEKQRLTALRSIDDGEGASDGTETESPGVSEHGEPTDAPTSIPTGPGSSGTSDHRSPNSAPTSGGGATARPSSTITGVSSTTGDARPQTCPGTRDAHPSATRRRRPLAAAIGATIAITALVLGICLFFCRGARRSRARQMLSRLWGSRSNSLMPFLAQTDPAATAGIASKHLDPEEGKSATNGEGDLYRETGSISADLRRRPLSEPRVQDELERMRQRTIC